MLALFVLYNMFSSPFYLITCLASFVLAMLALWSLLGSLLSDTCVVCIPIYWNYRHQIKTYICPLRTPFICLLVLASSHAFFPCLLACMSSFLCLLALFISLVLSMLVCYPPACLLLKFPLFVACTHGAWVQLLNASKSAKISKLGGLASSWGPFSLSQPFLFGLFL